MKKAPDYSGVVWPVGEKTHTACRGHGPSRNRTVDPNYSPNSLHPIIPLYFSIHHFPVPALLPKHFPE